MEPDSKNLVSNHCKHFEINQDRVHQILTTIQTSLHLTGSSIDLSFVDGEEIQHINNDHRQKNAPTDVLSFPQWEWQKALTAEDQNPRSLIADPIPAEIDLMLGDIIICPEVAAKNAEQINQSTEREICFLAVHGTLHLCGHDHQNEQEEQVMIAEQKRIMGILEKQSLCSDIIRRQN